MIEDREGYLKGKWEYLRIFLRENSYSPENLEHLSKWVETLMTVADDDFLRGIQDLKKGRVSPYVPLGQKVLDEYC